MPKINVRSIANSLRALTIASAVATTPAFAQQAPNTATSQPAEDKPLHLGPHDKVKPPKLLHSVQPEYPKAARKSGLHPTVEVYLWIEKSGDPSHIRIMRSSGPDFDQSATEAVQQFKFRPATLNGQPVKVDLYVSVDFIPE
jgi:TonB family protein